MNVSSRSLKMTRCPAKPEIRRIVSDGSHYSGIWQGQDIGLHTYIHTYIHKIFNKDNMTKRNCHRCSKLLRTCSFIAVYRVHRFDSHAKCTVMSKQELIRR